MKTSKKKLKGMSLFEIIISIAVLAIMGMGSITVGMDPVAGAKLFAAAMPLAISGLISGIFQGKTAVGGIYAIAKNESLSGKLILFPAMVETYAILGLVVSILLM